MSYFEQLIHFYQTTIECAYNLEADFDLKQAKSLRKSLVQKDKQVAKLIHDYEASLQLVSFNNNQDAKQTIKDQLALMQSVFEFNSIVLRYDVKTPKGYYMFIKDIIAHSYLLPI